MIRTVLLSMIATFALGAAAAVPVAADEPAERGLPATVFSNTAPITINDNPPGIATPYPSTITVGGVTDPVTDVAVTLTGFDHDWTKELDLMLVGPTGVAVMLMSDIPSYLESGVVDLTLAADGNPFPWDPAGTTLPSGTYRPTDYTEEEGTDAGEPPPPAPQASTTDLTTYRGLDPNGTWSLYVFDDCFCGGFSPGVIGGGWSLTLSGSTTCSAAADAARAECQVESFARYRFLTHLFPDKVKDSREAEVIAVQAGAKGKTKPTTDFLEQVQWRGTLVVQAETTGRDDTTVLTLAGRAWVFTQTPIRIQGPVLVDHSNLRGCRDGARGRLIMTNRLGDGTDAVAVEYCGRTFVWHQPPSDAFVVRLEVVDLVPGRR